MSDQKICPTCSTEYPLSERFCPRDGTALRSSNPLGDLLGTVVAERYHILRKLGEGGMGTVYLAEHVKMGRKAALKVMNPGMNQDPDAIARFNREAANASRLNHPNVCGIYDFGETTDGLIYLAMEFIEGESLTSLIAKTGSLPAPRAAAIIHQAADALAAAHDHGIVHRDLKPDNIMIAKGREGADVVKVVDFGIAKASASDAQKVTRTGLVVGTPEYMSPEQLAGDTLDGRSDIYSLGLVAFNCLTGTLPFPSNSAQEAMIMRLTDEPKTLTDMKPGVAWPAALQTVMDKALARDAVDRYQQAAEFGRDIVKAVSQMPATLAASESTLVMGAAKTVAAATVPKTRVAQQPAGGASDAASAAPAPTATNTKSQLPLLVGGGVLVAAIAVAVVMMRGPASPAASGATETKSSPSPVSSEAAVPSQGAPAPAGSGAKPAAGGAPGTSPAPTNPGATVPRTNSGASAAAEPQQLLARWSKRFAEGGSAAEAREALDDVSRVLPAANGSTKGLAYWVQSMAYAVLEDKRTCRSAQQAIASGLTNDDLPAAKSVVASDLCKP